MGEDTTLVDDLGRQRILQLCDDAQETCRRLSAADDRRKLEMELRDAVMGTSRWLLPSEGSAEELVPEDAESGRPAKHLLVARGKKPLSLFDGKTWTMAKPKLWRYGDAGNLFGRDEALPTVLARACKAHFVGHVRLPQQWIRSPPAAKDHWPKRTCRAWVALEHKHDSNLDAQMPETCRRPRCHPPDACAVALVPFVGNCPAPKRCWQVILLPVSAAIGAYTAPRRSTDNNFQTASGFNVKV